MMSGPQKEPELAVLFGVPHEGEISMHNDVAAMYDALRARGLAPEQIICLEGQLDRQMMLGFLVAIGQRVAHGTAGHLFLFVSGHGYASLDSRQTTRVGVDLSPGDQTPDGNHVYWDEVFRALAVPSTVHVTLLPDH
jgi:hypothetical protein